MSFYCRYFKKITKNIKTQTLHILRIRILIRKYYIIIYRKISQKRLPFIKVSNDISNASNSNKIVVKYTLIYVEDSFVSLK